MFFIENGNLTLNFFMDNIFLIDIMLTHYVFKMVEFADTADMEHII